MNILQTINLLNIERVMSKDERTTETFRKFGFESYIKVGAIYFIHWELLKIKMPVDKQYSSIYYFCEFLGLSIYMRKRCLLKIILSFCYFRSLKESLSCWYAQPHR